MASLRDVRLKIRSVKNISQITQAMKLVAAAKLRRVQERVEQGKPYSQTMADLVGMLAPNVREFKHPLLDERPVGAAGIIVIAADKGLAGSYNSNLLRIAHQFVDRKRAELQGSTLAAGREPVQIITVGRKATDYFSKRGYNVVQSFPSIGDKSSYDQVRAIANAVTGMFLTSQVDEVHLCFTEFVNTITQRPQVIKFLPIEPPSGMGEEDSSPAATGKLDFIFEPDAPELLGVLLPRFVETRVYQLLLEAVASEFGARMTAMTNATKNAKEQIDDLTLLANRTRQAMVTTELLDIVGGAEALKG
jgi:F-type H+-transporting ATPase subunit gamma